MQEKELQRSLMVVQANDPLHRYIPGIHTLIP